MQNITLNTGQEAVASGFLEFLMGPEKYFVLKGYSGTGKSTMIKVILERLENYFKAALLINPAIPRYEVMLSATTNKAADNFGSIAKMDCSTVHNRLGLTLAKDFKTGENFLQVRKNVSQLHNTLLFIDEASYINGELMKLIQEQTTDSCKVVFIGDPDQLLSPKSTTAIAFNSGFMTRELTETMRQLVNGVPQANPITELAHGFRKVLHGQPWPRPKMDNQYLFWKKEDEFEELSLREFSRADWEYSDSKILGYTNKAAIYYNNMVRNHIHGDPRIQVGDYVENNSFIAGAGSGHPAVKTDELVLVTDIEEDSQEHGVNGRWLTINHGPRFFMPFDRKAKQQREAYARAQGEWHLLREIERWIDLRAVFGQTTNKAQGSTYKKVFINLNDMATCNWTDQLARMLYVATSRASEQVIFTGDLA